LVDVWAYIVPAVSRVEMSLLKLSVGSPVEVATAELMEGVSMSPEEVVVPREFCVVVVTTSGVDSVATVVSLIARVVVVVPGSFSEVMIVLPNSVDVSVVMSVVNVDSSSVVTVSDTWVVVVSSEVVVVISSAVVVVVSSAVVVVVSSAVAVVVSSAVVVVVSSAVVVVVSSATTPIKIVPDAVPEAVVVDVKVASPAGNVVVVVT
jgi:hypothetical protein